MRQMIKIIKNKQLLAVIVRAKDQNELDGFITDSQSPLQLGFIKYDKDRQVTPHQHRKLTKTTHQNQEFIYVVAGQVEAKFYYKNQAIKTVVLEAGDTLLQLAGGHGFTFLKPTRLITIKQGPYTTRTHEKIELDLPKV